jgi:hypothetical protein
VSAVDVLVTHQRISMSGCMCGGVQLGESFAQHQVDMLVSAGHLVGDDRIDRALAVLNGAPIPMGEVRARHAAAILRGDRDVSRGDAR